MRVGERSQVDIIFYTIYLFLYLKLETLKRGTTVNYIFVYKILTEKERGVIELGNYVV